MTHVAIRSAPHLDKHRMNSLPTPYPEFIGKCSYYLYKRPFPKSNPSHLTSLSQLLPAFDDRGRFLEKTKLPTNTVVNLSSSISQRERI